MLKAIVFDLDNTLVSCSLNFSRLREVLGCPDDMDLLEHASSHPSVTERKRLHAIIIEHEIEDAKSSSLMKGASELLLWMTLAKLYSGVITRNCHQAAQAKLDANELKIEVLITREDFPAKPDPTALFHLMECWHLASKEVLYVGDHEYDVLTAKNAGCLSCLITNGDHVAPEQTQADLIFSSLEELHQHIINSGYY
ncbi:Phosphoglycolate phosphatase [Vibrio thalassae]|uniref:Phosphoglycolate phosphatase n=1 Tax=Vibrio thalassae TaxID=1243014 RepID=A0A240EIJ2_9VIBR|nr:HAD family hydrolase [Vibrio thalassae]SNX48508.1 Phosphoglycolate phosphatase [Vibrio thalassae]